MKQGFRKFMRRLDEDSTLGSSPATWRKDAQRLFRPFKDALRSHCRLAFPRLEARRAAIQGS